MILVTNEDHHLEATLDDELGTLVAWEQTNVYCTPLHRGGVLIQDGIHLGMTNCVCVCGCV